MFTSFDIKEIINYISENFIICQFTNGDSKFTELLLKEDVYVDGVPNRGDSNNVDI